MSSRTVLSIVANAVVAPVRVAMTTANSARVTGERRPLLRADRDGQFPQASTLCATTLPRQTRHAASMGLLGLLGSAGPGVPFSSSPARRDATSRKHGRGLPAGA